MTKQVKGSIIIPVFNCEFLIKETLDSILKQAFIDWECIVVDVGFSNETINVVNSYVEMDGSIKSIYFELAQTHVLNLIEKIKYLSNALIHLSFINIEDLKYDLYKIKRVIIY